VCLDINKKDINLDGFNGFYMGFYMGFMVFRWVLWVLDGFLPAAEGGDVYVVGECVCEAHGYSYG
jgi:hypothetical protein